MEKIVMYLLKIGSRKIVMTEHQQCSSQKFYLIIPIHQSQFDTFGKNKNFLFEKSSIKI